MLKTYELAGEHIKEENKDHRLEDKFLKTWDR